MSGGVSTGQRGSINTGRGAIDAGRGHKKYRTGSDKCRTVAWIQNGGPIKSRAASIIHDNRKQIQDRGR